ncbi:MAG: DNA repair and recombination protein RadB [Methanobrevibacter boviskoreani]|jgi:DNA repair protein RadB|uniref:DNA repair and recombination protein RadB n=1 Tax=Methanobrevibacter boviskoreani TaxID=1348249 RepID=UPI000594538F|nr:DNA repair and recombination protein RadB [Methanobrevibacter boviskoreani]MDD6256324.1 DNA repair and recombination protein RadB [Methanobrevibacter boviskoreani]
MKTLNKIGNSKKIPTNSSIDEILNGGIEKGIITQIFGPPGSGKTNIALQLSVEVAKTGRKVIYIDTEGGISVDRIQQIAKDRFDEIANNIIILEPTDFDEQYDDLIIVETWLKNNKEEEVDLVILDSAVALYRSDDRKSSILNKNLGMQMKQLSAIARKYNLAVLVTNQIYSSFGDDNTEPSVKAVGGTTLQYWSKVIIQLEKTGMIGQRIATVKRHNSLAEGKIINFLITQDGIR